MSDRQFSRRELLRQIAGLATAWPSSGRRVPSLSAESQGTGVASVQGEGQIPLSKEDDQFLEKVERANFRFFWEQASSQTGLVKDRCNVHADGTAVVASIAATGFGLTALCIGEKRRYLPSREAYTRALTALRFLWGKLPNHRGFFFHFADVNTGARLWDSEVSSADTAILLCGVLTCREHFRSPEIRRLSLDIFNRVEWNWLAEDTRMLSHGWMPEVGFLPYRWDDYSELMMLYLLGMGSLTSPLKADTWTAWTRTKFEYDGLRYIGSFAPLFVHQYSQAWFDFRNRRDRYADYFQNSTSATEAHRLFRLDLAKQFRDHGDDLWGITASCPVLRAVRWHSCPRKHCASFATSGRDTEIRPGASMDSSTLSTPSPNGLTRT